MNLYWVTTNQHEEDWFIVAESPEEAAKHHEDFEGYDPGEAVAEFVLEIPENMDAEAGWPSEDLLLSLGAKYIRTNPRVIELNGRTFAEGLMESLIEEADDIMLEAAGKKRPGIAKKTIH